MPSTCMYDYPQCVGQSLNGCLTYSITSLHYFQLMCTGSSMRMVSLRRSVSNTSQWCTVIQFSQWWPSWRPWRDYRYPSTTQQELWVLGHNCYYCASLSHTHHTHVHIQNFVCRVILNLYLARKDMELSNMWNYLATACDCMQVQI